MISDPIKKPTHYNTGKVEAIDAIRSALGDGFIAYCRGNALKYVWRAPYKGKQSEDLRKAVQYLEWAIRECEK